MNKTTTTKNNSEIPEAKIRQAIWYLKSGSTKKFVCDHLGIAYNTKRLDSIIEDFRKKQDREGQLKTIAKNKVFTEQEKLNIAKSYLAGETQAALAKQNHVSSAKIKKILIETNTPIKARGKNKQANVSHITQDLDTKLRKNDKVFIADLNCFGIIDHVYDENYLEYLENGRQRYVELHKFKEGGKYSEPVEGIHYEIYWTLEDGADYKVSAIRNIRSKIIKNLEETGREYYRVWRDDDYKCFYFLNRDKIYPVSV